MAEEKINLKVTLGLYKSLSGIIQRYITATKTESNSAKVGKTLKYLQNHIIDAEKNDQGQFDISLNRRELSLLSKIFRNYFVEQLQEEQKIKDTELYKFHQQVSVLSGSSRVEASKMKKIEDLIHRY